MPDLVQQLDALENGAGIVRLGGRTQLEITGTDRAKFLHNFCTGDIKSLSPGSGCEAFVTSIQGKILGHILVFCQKESLVVETVPNQAGFLVEHLDKYLFTDDVEFVDQSDQYSELLLAGPNAPGVLKSRFHADPPGLMQHVDVDCGQVRHVEMLGPTTFLISCENDAIGRVASSLEVEGAILCERAAADARRIQIGWPEFGKDVTEANLPQEVDRDKQAICFTKGCYLGQETVARIDAMGHVNRRLVGLKFKSQTHVDAPIELYSSDKVVGGVTSAVFHPSFNSVIALGYVRQAHAKSGNVLTSKAGEVVVADLPLGVEI